MALPEPNATEHDIFGQQLKENKGGKGKRIWKALGLTVLSLSVAGAAFFGFTQQGQKLSNLGSEGFKGAMVAKTNPDLIFNTYGNQVNILLIGRDVNWKIGKVLDPTTGKYRPYQVHDESARARSDTMIVVSLDRTRNTVRMVSFPRDAIVRLADNDFGVRRTKLNAAHSYGGPELLIRTFQEELGLTIHRHAVIKFDGFKGLIDQVGGVEVNVEGALMKDRNGKLYRGNLDYDDKWGNLHVHLKPGVQILDGEQAHGYVRFRMDREGDPGRIRRQQQVMRALAKQMMHVPFWSLPGLIDELQKQFITDLTTEELASAATFAKNLGDAGKIQPLTLFGTYYDGGSICLNKPKNIKLLSHIFGSTFNAENFLNRSPSTSGDDIGPANNASPDTLTLLREAGIIGEDDMPPSPESTVPVRIDGAGEAEASTGTRRRGRLAAAPEEEEETHSTRRERERKGTSTRKTRASGEADNPQQNITVDVVPLPADELIGGSAARHDLSGRDQESGSSTPSSRPEPASNGVPSNGVQSNGVQSGEPAVDSVAPQPE